ncbi:MAG: hypothetical protein CENE_00963 [Candidatus Celerinatantimonas neptuna]|nr:MAG: hypothetical protein CENE_00963 [Candidatus Celerinatantimonas neptuna]
MVQLSELIIEIMHYSRAYDHLGMIFIGLGNSLSDESRLFSLPLRFNEKLEQYVLVEYRPHRSLNH